MTTSPKALALFTACEQGQFITLRHLRSACTQHPQTGHFAPGATHDQEGNPIPALHTTPLACAEALADLGWDYSVLCRRNS